MKIWLKVLLGVIGGFGAGFASGFFVHKKINDVQFEEVSEEDLDKLLEGLQDGTKNLPSGNEDAAKKADFDRNKAIQEAGTNPDKLRNALQGKTPYIQADNDKKKEYSKIWNTVKSYSNEENADEIPTESNDISEEDDVSEHMEALENEIADEVAEPEPKKEPYMITLGEFYDERREYDKITIDWYDGDNVVLDETENPIADVISYVGCDMNTLFGRPPADGDPDSRFVRNDRYGTDYEIIRHHGSWHELSGE